MHFSFWLYFRDDDYGGQDDPSVCPDSQFCPEHAATLTRTTLNPKKSPLHGSAILMPALSTLI